MESNEYATPPMSKNPKHIKAFTNGGKLWGEGKPGENPNSPRDFT